ELAVDRGVADRELVVGGAAGVLAGRGGERALGGDPRLAAPHRLLVEGGRRQVPVDGAGLRDPLLLDAKIADERSHVLHDAPRILTDRASQNGKRRILAIGLQSCKSHQIGPYLAPVGLASRLTAPTFYLCRCKAILGAPSEGAE